jgi:hypothetical protein
LAAPGCAKPTGIPDSARKARLVSRSRFTAVRQEPSSVPCSGEGIAAPGFSGNPRGSARLIGIFGGLCGALPVAGTWHLRAPACLRRSARGG